MICDRFLQNSAHFFFFLNVTWPGKCQTEIFLSSLTLDPSPRAVLAPFRRRPQVLLLSLLNPPNLVILFSELGSRPLLQLRLSMLPPIVAAHDFSNFTHQSFFHAQPAVYPLLARGYHGARIALVRIFPLGLCSPPLRVLIVFATKPFPQHTRTFFYICNLFIMPTVFFGRSLCRSPSWALL